jgi:hypothetical protein
MKYHSLYWWLIAIREQFKHIVRNVLCRKILNIEFGYTIPDLLNMYILDNQEVLYKIIISKYPGLRNIKKYIKDGTANTVSEFVLAGAFSCYDKSISVFWTNEGNLEDIMFLLKNNIPVNLTILNTLNSNHSVTVVGFDEINKYLIVNDPLGDPWLRYIFVFGYGIEISIHKLIEIVGKNMKLNFYINNEKEEIINEIKKRFDTRKLYSLEAEDYNKGMILEKNNFTFIKYTKDGKINVMIDLGEEAKNHFIHFYGEYNLNKRISWKNIRLDIMEIIAKLNVEKYLNIK